MESKLYAARQAYTIMALLARAPAAKPERKPVNRLLLLAGVRFELIYVSFDVSQPVRMEE